MVGDGFCDSLAFSVHRQALIKRQLRHGRLASFDRLAGLGYL